jgi:hypothetical protein
MGRIVLPLSNEPDPSPPALRRVTTHAILCATADTPPLPSPTTAPGSRSSSRIGRSAARGATCPVRLVDPSVSNYHCSLTHTTGEVLVVDLLGLGGVRVNGHEVGYARLDRPGP